MGQMAVSAEEKHGGDWEEAEERGLSFISMGHGDSKASVTVGSLTCLPGNLVLQSQAPSG